MGEEHPGKSRVRFKSILKSFKSPVLISRRVLIIESSMFLVDLAVSEILLLLRSAMPEGYLNSRELINCCPP